ncbi:hypothetical protein DFH29DRAFT_1006564 [Suillus ampliporus]|nr:hypothetical protein DFH29DRAFT_1006564 [Suillus ampliporus]
MMEAMKDIPGVPKLEEYCKVVLPSSKIDNTQNYRYSQSASSEGTWRTYVRLVMKPQGQCLQEFQMRKEFVWAICDIVIIQKRAVQEQWILHCDCSLYNTMIEDKDDGSSNGMLIDWEFTVCILEDGHYPLGGISAKGMYFLNIGELLQQFDTYFAPLLPLMWDWTDLLCHNFPSTTTEGKITEHKPITFNGIIELLDKDLTLLPDDELSPEHLFRKMLMNKNIQDVANRVNIIKNICSSGAAISTSTTQKKCGLNDTWTIEPANSLVKWSCKQMLAGDSKPEVSR